MLKIKNLLLLIALLGYCYADNDANISTNSDNSFNYYFRGETLKQALDKYANTNGLKIKYSSMSDYMKLSKAVTGRISVAKQVDLLDTLAKQYGFKWFTYSGTLYITSNEDITKTIYVSPDNMPNVKSVLLQSGLLNTKFGYSELPAENKIVISGPIAYVNMVMEQIKSFNISPVAEQYAVYHLKYASAVDTILSFNNQQITIPGVATILQLMVQKGNINASSNRKPNISQNVMEPLTNSNQTKSTVDTNNDSNDSVAKVGNSIIQADARLNTIIIRDKKTNLDMYKNLIKLLDVPAPLIQVDVLIIHLDKDVLDNEGIDWWASSNLGYKGGFNAGNLGNSNNNNLSFYYGQINPGQLLVSNANNFAVSLQFLEQHRVAKAVGRPSVATIDNIPAIVNVTENLYLNSTPQNGNNSSGNNNNNNNYNNMSVTTSLQITPHVIYNSDTGKNDIKLAILLQDGSIADPTNSVLSNTVQSNINSQAVVQEGQSIVLAGYSKNTNEKIVKKVPFLGDIPLLGWFFRSSTVQTKKIDTIYLVTPKIVGFNDTTKLKDYVTVGGEQFDVKQDFNIKQPTKTGKK
jgi:type III secretion protein C